MAAAGAGSAAAPNVWRQIFGVFVDPAAYKALVYMILSLATGITYFTLVVTGVSTAGGMLVLIVGVPLFLLVLGMVHTDAAPGAGRTSQHEPASARVVLGEGRPDVGLDGPT